MYWSDYHIHTHFSADSEESLLAHVRAAQQKGLHEICFTDHYDSDFPKLHEKSWACDVKAAFEAIDALKTNIPNLSLKIKKGVEMGLQPAPDTLSKTLAYLQDFDFDFIIASVHLVNGVDPYFPAYFDGKTRQEGFALYIETLLECLQKTDRYCVAGHFDYPSKGCPYPDAALHYEDAPDQIDTLFRHLISKGKFVEINTSILKRKEARPRDINIWKRYVELGGEAVTMGSDAHSSDFLAYEFDETRAFLREAGVKYIATFDRMKALFTPV